MNTAKVNNDFLERLIANNVKLPPTMFQARVYVGEARAAGYDVDVEYTPTLYRSMKFRNWSRSSEWQDELKAAYQEEGCLFNPLGESQSKPDTMRSGNAILYVIDLSGTLAPFRFVGGGMSVDDDGTMSFWEADPVSAHVREKMREEGFLRRLLPPNPIV